MDGGLSIQIISLYISSYLCLPLVSVVEELLLVVEQLFVGFSGKLEIGTLKTEGQRVDGERSVREARDQR